jgi:CMP/dCMP kinase
VAWLASEHRIRPDHAKAVIERVREAEFKFELSRKELFFQIDGINPEPYLRGEQVNRTVSAISAIAEVREILVVHLRSFLTWDNLVMEGRDIGSVVFPDTLYKFYIDASPEVRAQRRATQGQRDDLLFRDSADASRHASPLTVAEDAFVIDSSSLTIDGVVAEIIGHLKLQGLPEALLLD